MTASTRQNLIDTLLKCFTSIVLIPDRSGAAVE